MIRLRSASLVLTILLTLALIVSCDSGSSPTDVDDRTPREEPRDSTPGEDGDQPDDGDTGGDQPDDGDDGTAGGDDGGDDPGTDLPVVELNDPLVLTGDTVLELTGAHYRVRNDIRLSDDATLVIRDALFEHQKDYTFQYSLEATGNSRVIVENSRIANSCNGSLNWNFFDSARLETDGVEQEQCNIWHFFTNSATARIRNHRFNGTFCNESSGDIEGGIEMEVELCWNEGAVVDEELPTEVTDFSFPNAGDENITFQLDIRNSTIDGWGVGVYPNSNITLRNSPALTVAVIVGLPWRDQTVVLDSLVSQTYEDRTWEIAEGSTLRLVNSATYGWEANAFCCNTLIVRNSDYAASNINSGDAVYFIENSTVGELGTQERTRMTVTGSHVTGNVVARDNSLITLVDTEVDGEIVEEGSGQVVIE